MRHEVAGGLFEVHRLAQRHPLRVVPRLRQAARRRLGHGRHQPQRPAGFARGSRELRRGLLRHGLGVVDQQHEPGPVGVRAPRVRNDGADGVVAGAAAQQIHGPGAERRGRHRSVREVHRAQLGGEAPGEQAQQERLADPGNAAEHRRAVLVAHRANESLERPLRGHTRHVARRIGAGPEGVDEVEAGAAGATRHEPSGLPPCIARRSPRDGIRSLRRRSTGPPRHLRH